MVTVTITVNTKTSSQRKKPDLSAISFLKTHFQYYRIICDRSDCLLKPKIVLENAGEIIKDVSQRIKMMEGCSKSLHHAYKMF